MQLKGTIPLVMINIVISKIKIWENTFLMVFLFYLSSLCLIFISNNEGEVLCTRSSSCSGGWDRRTAWAREFKVSLGNPIYKKKKEAGNNLRILGQVRWHTFLQAAIFLAHCYESTSHSTWGPSWPLFEVPGL